MKHCSMLVSMFELCSWCYRKQKNNLSARLFCSECVKRKEQDIKRKRQDHWAFIFIWIDGKRLLHTLLFRSLSVSIFFLSFAPHNRNMLLTLKTIMLSSEICKLNSRSSYCNLALEFHYCLFGMRCIVQKDSCVSISDTLNKNTSIWSTDESWLKCVFCLSKAVGTIEN